MSSVTSANLDDMATFVNGSNAQIERLTSSVQAAAAKANVVSNHTFNIPSTHSLQSLGSLLANWAANQNFVTCVRSDLERANNFDSYGNATIEDAVIQRTLVANGLTKTPGVVTVAAVEMYGQPPFSGFIDDPIALATGNFLQVDTDLIVFGRAGLISVTRTYNSLDGRKGRFGAGWSSLADVALDVDSDHVVFRGPDGGGAEFWRDGDSANWSGGRRRRLALRSEPDGSWEVIEDRERRWQFDAAGQLRAVRADDIDVSVRRFAESLVFHEQISDRWVGYEIEDQTGLVRSARTSDGRVATYRYDDELRLVDIDRASGNLTYEIDEDGLLAAVIDADGVVLCRNAYDQYRRVVTQVSPHGREAHYSYGNDGVSTVTLPSGEVTGTMVHDRRGRLTAMIDAHGHTMRLAYDDADNLVQIVDRTGAITRMRYDDRGNLVERWDEAGVDHAWTWDDQDRLASETDRAGHTMAYEYGGKGRRPTTIRRPDGSAVVTTFDATGRPTSVTDDDGVTMAMSWNADGEIVESIDGVGNCAVLNYSEAGLPSSIELPEGQHAEARVDAAGRLVGLSSPDGDRTFVFTAAGRLVGGTDITGASWSATLDAAGEIVGVFDGDTAVLSVERDDLGRVIALTDARDGVTRFEHDALGRVVSTTDAVGARTLFSHDAEGRLVGVTDASGRRVVVERDDEGRWVTIRLPGGAQVAATYHPTGELASHTDQLGHTWTYEIDAVGRVTGSTDPLGGVTAYGYTRAGRLAETRSPEGRVVRRSYDPAGQLVGLVGADGTEEVFERRGDGALRSATHAGSVTAFEYDEVGRTTAIAGPWGSLGLEREAGELTALSRNGSAPSRFEYGPLRLLVQASDPAGVLTELVRDAAGGVVEVSTGGERARYEWDLAGRIAAYVDSGGRRTEYHHDDRGVLDRIDTPDGGSTVFGFGPDGLLAEVRDREGEVLLELARDAAGEVVSATANGASLSSSRDAIGRVTEITTGVGAVQYQWDADGFLVGLADSTGHRLQIERDEAGSAVAFEASGRRVEAPADRPLERDEARRIVVDEQGRRFAYDAAGRLASVVVDGATTTYDYDPLGRLAHEIGPDGGRTYEHGRGGELVRLVDADGSDFLYEYDEIGRRIGERRSDGSTVAYGWSALGRLERVVRRNPTGVESSVDIVYDPLGRPMLVGDVPVLWGGVGSNDLLGVGNERYAWSGSQVCVLTDPQSGWDSRTPDDPWGLDGGVGVRIGYRGELALDDLVFLGARVYDAASRTFLSQDPSPAAPGDLDVASPYAYAWNDPVNLVDPTGLKPLSDEDYDKYRKSTEKFLWKGAVVVAGVVAGAAATILLPGVGAVIAAGVIGAVTSGSVAALNQSSGGVILRDAIIGGLLAAGTAGLANKMPFLQPSTATSLARRVGENAAKEFTEEATENTSKLLLDTYLLPEGDRRISLDDVTQLGAETVFGTVVGTGAAEIHLPGHSGGHAPDVKGGRNPSPFDNVNRMSATDLDTIPGIGPVLADRVVHQRTSFGGFTDPTQLDAIPGIGPKRLQAILSAH